MRAAVLAAFPGFSTRFEGRVPYMYTDVLGLVTTGVGNLIDNGPRRRSRDDDVGGATPAVALPLPWQRSDGSAASFDEISAEWWKVKNAWPDVQSVATRSITSLRLDDDAIDQLVIKKARENEAILRDRYPGFDQFPADAQLGLHSMAWAMGPAFNFPAFSRAIVSGDWQTAAEQSQINAAGNPGLVPRNEANRLLFENAGAVIAQGLDPERLYYPERAAPGGGTIGAPAVAASHPVSRIVEAVLVVGLLSAGAAAAMALGWVPTPLPLRAPIARVRRVIA